MTSSLAVQRLSQLRNSDEGQALVLTSVAMIALLAMAGLGVDAGFLRYQKQQMQKAADAGAAAGAAALAYAGNYTAAARNDSAANGFSNGTNNIAVAVNSPPTSGPNQTSTYVEVIVSQPQPTFFMKVLGFTSVNVSARAVASAARSSLACIYALDPTDVDSFVVKGTATINSACGIKVNSNNSSEAFDKTGSGTVRVTSGGIGIVGGITQVGSGSISPTPITGIAPFSDPLAGLSAPAVGTGCDFTNKKITGSGGASLTPGTYCNGITITGSGTVNFASGTYILMGGGFSTTGSATLVGSNLTFYDTADSGHSYGPIKLAGSAGTTLSAPSIGPLAGVLFFQDRSIPVGSSGNSFDGSNGEIYTGALYFKTTTLSYTGTTSLNAYTILVGWQISMVGTSDLNNDYSSLPGGISPIHTSGLAE